MSDILTGLDKQIADARAAAEKIAVVRELEAQADSLPALEAAKVKAERLAALGAEEEAADWLTAAILAELAPQCDAFRASLAKHKAEAAGLCAEALRLEKERQRAQAANDRAAALHRQSLALRHGTEPGGDGGRQAKWIAAGGANPALETLSADPDVRKRQKEVLAFPTDFVSHPTWRRGVGG